MKMNGAAKGGRLKGVMSAFCHFGDAGNVFKVRCSGDLGSLDGASNGASAFSTFSSGDSVCSSVDFAGSAWEFSCLVAD